MARAGTIEVDIRANSQQFVREMSKVSRSTQTISKQLTSFARSATAAFAVFGGGNLVRSIINTADQIEKFSTRIGVSGQELQAWQLIAERANVPINSLNTGIQRLTRRSAEAAKGMGEAKGALKELGIDAQSFNNLSLDDRMLKLAAAFEGVASESDKVRLAFKLFDTEGVGFLQFLNQGAAGLNTLRQELDGQIWSDEERKKLSQLSDELTELQQSLKLAFGGPIVSLLTTFTDLFRKAQDTLVKYVRTAQAIAGNQIAADKLNAGLLAGSQASSPVPGINPTVSLRGAAGTPGGLRGPQPGTGFELRSGTQSNDVDNAVEWAIEWGNAQQKVMNGQMEMMKEAEKGFVNLFTNNMVQAADSGFSSVLDSWRRTLLQMTLEAVNSQLFKMLAGTGFGQGLFGALGLPGFDAASKDAAIRGG